MTKPRPHAHAGLTLLELVVVLAVLVVLGTAVVTNTSGLADQARIEQTTRSLESLREAVVGRPGGWLDDPTHRPACFVGDIGRSPKAYEIMIQGQSQLTPAELWHAQPDATSAALPLYEARPVAGDSDPDWKIATGWRGPYIMLPSGAPAPLDGWRRPHALLQPDGSPVTLPGQAVGAIRASSLPAVPPAEGDLTVTWRDDSQDPAHVPDLSRGVVYLRLQDSASITYAGLPTDQMIVVRLYGPRDGQPAALAQWPAAGATRPTSIPDPIELADDLGHRTFSVGSRYLRVYVWRDNVAPALADDLHEPATSGDPDGRLVASGRPRRIEIQRGGTLAEMSLPELP